MQVVRDAGGITALPHESYTGDPVGRVVQGAGVGSLAARETGPWNDEAMGRAILRLVAATRDHAYA